MGTDTTTEELIKMFGDENIETALINPKDRRSGWVLMTTVDEAISQLMELDCNFVVGGRKIRVSFSSKRTLR